jgi:GTP-binding protein EngB required for normal cell division
MQIIDKTLNDYAKELKQEILNITERVDKMKNENNNCTMSIEDDTSYDSLLKRYILLEEENTKYKIALLNLALKMI